MECFWNHIGELPNRFTRFVRLSTGGPQGTAGRGADTLPAGGTVDLFGPGYHCGMASPYKHNKKTRRGLRKSGQNFLAAISVFQETQPEVAAPLKKIAEYLVKTANAKRKKRPKAPKSKSQPKKTSY
jgi:hypothetical protein